MRYERFAAAVVGLTSTAVVLLISARAEAYPDWASGCVTCHGAFASGTYVSRHDGSSWGTNLMSGHLTYIIGSTGSTRCDVCHDGASRTPTYLNLSNGAGTLAKIGCVGCHGRAQDNTATNPDYGSKGGYGAGLRQHHYKAGTTVCATCHLDANPASYTPVGENVLPPYYGNTSFPLLPTNSCNPSNTENRIGSSLGLDNDGNNTYDMTDPACSCTPTTCGTQGKNCGSISDGCGGTLSCGTCTSPQTCGGGGTANVCGCTPTTCGAQGKNCGSISDGCGGTLSCGVCTGSQTCGGGGTPNVCGCTPTTCGAQGKNCGSISDGCGGTLNCGTCTSPQTCGGGGAANVCGTGPCTPTTCAAQGKNCDNISDGCGGTLNCGTCTSPQTCGGTGTANLCGCTPATCGALALQCGAASDRCGGTLDCGGCGAGETCTANVCVAADAGAGDAGADAAGGDAGAGDAGNDGAAIDGGGGTDAGGNGDAAASDSGASGDAGAVADAAGVRADGSTIGGDSGPNVTPYDQMTDAGGGAEAIVGNDSGCGCRTVGGKRSSGSSWAWLLAAAGLATLARRRRSSKHER